MLYSLHQVVKNDFWTVVLSVNRVDGFQKKILKIINDEYFDDIYEYFDDIYEFFDDIYEYFDDIYE